MAVLCLRDAAAYVLYRMGCIHPFRLSRVLALAELKALERGLGRLTDARYVAGPGAFYIEGVKEAVEGDPCFAKREGDPAAGRKGCIEYRCEPPAGIPAEAKTLIDEAIEEARRLDDMELNRRVVEHPLFPRLAGQG